jgi:MoaA/NifB/PqqE/SkfB family radical SAM enzyme
MNDKRNIFLRLARLYRITDRASNHFSFQFFRENYKPITAKIKQRLSSKAALISGPLYAGIGVCNECNIKCLYCFEHSPLQIEDETKGQGNSYLRAVMNIDVFKEIVDDLADFGNRIISFVGRGESFLHPDFMRMCKYAIEKGQVCDVTSNGTLITGDYARLMVDLGIRKLDVSIGAANADTYHKLTGATPETFERIYETLKILTGYKKEKASTKPRVIITNVICSVNYFEVIEMIKRGIEADVDAVAFHRMYFCEKRRELVEPLLLNNNQTEELKKLLLEAITVAEKYNLETNIPFFLNLLFREKPRKAINYQRQPSRIKNDCMILADGAIYASDYPEIIGNINKSSFANVWYSNKYRQIRNRADILSRSTGLFPCVTFCRGCDRPLHKISQEIR